MRLHCENKGSSDRKTCFFHITQQTHIYHIYQNCHHPVSFRNCFSSMFSPRGCEDPFLEILRSLAQPGSAWQRPTDLALAAERWRVPWSCEPCECGSGIYWASGKPPVLHHFTYLNYMNWYVLYWFIRVLTRFWGWFSTIQSWSCISARIKVGLRIQGGCEVSLGKPWQEASLSTEPLLNRLMNRFMNPKIYPVHSSSIV